MYFSDPPFREHRLQGTHLMKIMRSGFHKYFFFIYCFLTSSATVFGQSYGLGFLSNETVQDERTGLDLSPGTTLCFKNNFQLSFDISFVPDQEEYFGYIVRIIDNKNRNIDLLTNIGSPGNKYFTFVMGDRSVNLPIDSNRVNLYEKWNKISFNFNYEAQTITYALHGKKYSRKISIDRNSCFKILFGANDVVNFKTTDVPPMKIRNIKIHVGNELKNSWPLNEEEGSIAVEEINRKNGLVNHPLWIKKTHRDWKLLKEFTADGPISVAFDAKNESLYFVGLDSLLTFSSTNQQVRSIKYNSGRLNLLRGNQSYFDETQRKLYNIYLDQKIITSFDFTTRTWNSNFQSPVPLTDNWQYNKFYSSTDSSFYIVGGYGHFLYKNDITRYHQPTNSWQTIKPSSNVFVPRYLAALGQVKGGAYILGGYGTQSGQQIHNPQTLYDLLFFNAADKKIKKINELKVQSEDFVFANSLVIDERTRSYYGLVFSKHKFNSTLQLIKGSLDSSEFSVVGNTMPYRFYDINSFSDLYYSAKSGKFIAVTLFLNNKNQTEVAVYSLASPPLIAGGSVTAAESKVPVYVFVISIGLILIIFLIYYYNRRLVRAKISENRRQIELSVPKDAGRDSQSASDPASFPVLADPDNIHHNVIYLFGDLQLFDPEGHDITKYFTPLIKELFLVILLYSIRWERGISSEKLKELLWFDKPIESARNNRSVNIAKLKTILDSMSYCTISKETGYWKTNIDFSKINVDYHNYLNIVKDKRELNKQRIKELTQIIQRGSFLSNLEYEWLDPFKSEISNQVIDIYQHYANSMEVSEDPEFMVEIANYIFYFDSVNEEAMMLKCKALVHLGKHSLAKGAFENFRKEYKVIYGEEFGKDFQAILE